MNSLLQINNTINSPATIEDLKLQFVGLNVATMPDFVEQVAAIVEVVVDFSNQLVHQHSHLVAAVAAVAVVVKMLQTGFVVVVVEVVVVVVLWK